MHPGLSLKRRRVSLLLSIVIKTAWHSKHMYLLPFHPIKSHHKLPGPLFCADRNFDVLWNVEFHNNNIFASRLFFLFYLPCADATCLLMMFWAYSVEPVSSTPWLLMMTLLRMPPSMGLLPSQVSLISTVISTVEVRDSLSVMVKPGSLKLSCLIPLLQLRTLNADKCMCSKS